MTVTGGEASYNGATGIQIETETRYATIDDVDAIGNGADHNGEAGIWIDESCFAIIKNCVVSSSTWGIIVSQSETIDIDTCYITDSGKAGIRINTGKHYYHLDGGSPVPNYPEMQEDGVRNLTICANCFFSNNTNEDILYGDARLPDDDKDYMIYYNNVYQGSSAIVKRLKFHLDGDETGYVANKLENLQ